MHCCGVVHCDRVVFHNCVSHCHSSHSRKPPTFAVSKAAVAQGLPNIPYVQVLGAIRLFAGTPAPPHAPQHTHSDATAPDYQRWRLLHEESPGSMSANKTMLCCQRKWHQPHDATRHRTWALSHHCLHLGDPMIVLHSTLCVFAFVACSGCVFVWSCCCVVV